MIDVKELRVGNWFEWDEPQTTIYGFAQVKSYHELGYSGIIMPIPLSPSILEKCGFEKHENSNEYWNHYILKNGWHISEALHDEKSAGVKKGKFYWSDEFIEFEYVHQMQNLFHSLYHKELEVKL